jgi:hypothetical protein
MVVVDMSNRMSAPNTATARKNKDWFIRHIPVKVKGRSPRPYRVPKLLSSIVLGVCLYLAVHLNSRPTYANEILLRRGERDLSSDPDYFAFYNSYPVQYDYQAMSARPLSRMVQNGGGAFEMEYQAPLPNQSGPVTP